MMTNTTWLEDIIQALTELGGQASLDDLYRNIASRRPVLSKRWKESVRKTIQIHSSDSISFDGKDDIFYAPFGPRKGVWALRKKK